MIEILYVLVAVLVVCLLVGAVYWAVTQIPLPEPFKTGAVIVLLVIFIIVLLYLLLGVLPGSLPRLK